MSRRSSLLFAAAAGACLFTLSLAAPASAFTLSGPSLAPASASQQIDKVWWRGGWGWGWRRPWGWGYRGWGYRGWGYRGYGYPAWHAYYGGWGRHCWRGYYGRLRCY